MQSFPDLKTVSSFCDPKEKELESEVIKAHQKASLGNGNVEKYVYMYFPKPKDFDSFVMTSQIMAGEAMRHAVESHRRSMPYCMGSLYWQLNDCWPVASWSSLDYYGNWKALHYFAKDFFNSVLISITEIEEDICIFIISDHDDLKQAELEIELFRLNGKLIKNKKITFNIQPNSSTRVLSVNKTNFLDSLNSNEIILRSSIVIDKKEISQSDYLFAKPKELILPKQNFKYNYHKHEGAHIITIEAISFLFRFYVLCANDTGVFSKNYFNMIPGDIVELQYLPSKKFIEDLSGQELQFEYNSVFGLSN